MSEDKAPEHDIKAPVPDWVKVKRDSVHARDEMMADFVHSHVCHEMTENAQTNVELRSMLSTMIRRQNETIEQQAKLLERQAEMIDKLIAIVDSFA
jgi:hypothetical protein